MIDAAIMLLLIWILCMILIIVLLIVIYDRVNNTNKKLGDIMEKMDEKQEFLEWIDSISEWKSNSKQKVFYL